MPSFFFSRIFLDLKGGREALEVESHRFFKNLVIVKLGGINSIDQAESLVGLTAFVSEGDLPPLTDEKFYVYRLQGFEVKTEAGKIIGRIRDAVSQPGHDMLIVEQQGREVFIPFVRSICTDIRVEEKTVIVDLPDGLLDLNEI